MRRSFVERLLEWHKDIDGYRRRTLPFAEAVAPPHVDGHGGRIRRGDDRGRARGNPHRTEDRDLMARVGEDKAVPGVFVSRSARLAATIASGWARTAVTVLIGLVSTPVLLRLLGPERFGAVRMAEQWFAYLEFLGFGLAAVVGVLLIRAATSGTAADVSGTAQTGISANPPTVSLGRCPRPSAWSLVFPIFFKLPANLRAEFYWGAPAILLWISLKPMIRVPVRTGGSSARVPRRHRAGRPVSAPSGDRYQLCGGWVRTDRAIVGDCPRCNDVSLCLRLLSRGDKKAVLVSRRLPHSPGVKYGGSNGRS